MKRFRTMVLIRGLLLGRLLDGAVVGAVEFLVGGPYGRVPTRQITPRRIGLLASGGDRAAGSRDAYQALGGCYGGLSAFSTR